MLRLVVASALLVALALTAAPSSALASASCGRIDVRNIRDGKTTYRVMRDGGSCAQARKVMRQWARTTYRVARAGGCQNSTCSNASPKPAGFSCRNGTAGDEMRSGLVQACRRGGVSYRSYSSPGGGDSMG